MNLKPWAEFASDLPDDHIENDEGTEIVQFGGKSVAAAIGELLEGFGCTVSPPIYADEHGWELDVKFNKRNLWCQITFLDGYIFVFQENYFLPRIWKRYHPDYLNLLMKLADALAQDSRFHNVRWYSNDQVLSGAPGALRPIEE